MVRAVAKLALICAVVSLVSVRSPAQAQKPASVVLNGDLAHGAGNSPDNWRTESWDQKPEVSSYVWKHPSEGQGELQVNNSQPNDARWTQSLELGPGWYRFETDLRTENVGTSQTGASISVMEDGITSEDIKGTADWQRVGFYLKVGPRGADIDLALRLGGYSSLNTGRAFFRKVTADHVAAPPASAKFQYDLDNIRKQGAGQPIGSLWTLIAAFVLLAAMAIFGWVTFGTVPVSSSGIETSRERPAKSARR